MNILQLVHTSLQHEPPVFALAECLAKRGHNVLCVGYLVAGVPSEQRAPAGYGIRRIQRGNYNWTPRLIRGAMRFLKYSAGVASVCRTFRPHVVIATAYDTLLLAAIFAPTTTRVVYYCMEYSKAPSLGDYLSGWGFVKRTECWSIRRADVLVSVEPNRAVLQSKQWGRAVDHVILNAPVHDLAVERRALDLLGCRTGPVRFVYAGTIDARVCISELVLAILRNPDAHLDIYGRIADSFQDRFSDLMNHVARHSESAIHYRGVVPYSSLAAVLTNYDVGIALYDSAHPNTQLASPAKLFDYMRAGLAVICTDQPTPARVVRKSCCGFTVPVENLSVLADIVKDVTADRQSLLALRRNALTAFATTFHYEVQASELVNSIVSDQQAALANRRSNPA